MCISGEMMRAAQHEPSLPASNQSNTLKEAKTLCKAAVGKPFHITRSHLRQSFFTQTLSNKSSTTPLMKSKWNVCGSQKKCRGWESFLANTHINITYLPWPTYIRESLMLCTLWSTKLYSLKTQSLILSSPHIVLQSFTVNIFSFHLRCLCNNNVCFQKGWIFFYPQTETIKTSLLPEEVWSVKPCIVVNCSARALV